MKTKMGKKVLPVLLSLLLVFGLMPATVFAADFNSGSNSANVFNWYSKDVSATDLSYEAGDGTIEWKADTKTLTLCNATVTASNVQISFPSNGNGMEINLVLEGDNVFQKSAVIQTGGCKVIVSGDGNLTMENTSFGFTVHPGGELIFSGTGKVKVEGSGTTALDIMNGGKVTVNSGDVEFTTSNGFGKAIRIQSNSTLIVERGSLTARMDKETTSSNAGAICCDDSTGSIAINGGKVTVSSTTVGISLKSATTIKGDAEVYVTSKSGYAIGGAAITITDAANVTAVSESNTAISGAVKISGNAIVLAEGGTTGISGMYGIPLVLKDSPKITAKGGTQAFNISNGMDTKGYTVKVGKEKDGSDAAAWDMEISFTKYGNDYKYAYIESCSHPNAADDSDCTTAVICPDCGITITEAYEMHNVDTWTSNHDETCTADGTKSGLCTRCGTKVTETDTGSMHAHTMKHYEAVPATCMTQGNVEYWHCSECNKNYASATGGETFNTVITDKNPDNHTGTVVWVQTETTHKQEYSCCHAEVSVEENHEWKNGKCTVCSYPCAHQGGEATCTQKAVCATCGSEYGEVNPDNHNPANEWTQENDKHYHVCLNGCGEHLDEADCSGGTATCKEQVACAVCGNQYGELAAHSLTEQPYKAATCEESGHKAYWECSVCNQLFSDAQGSTTTTIEAITISPKGHTMIKQEEVPATCTTDGKEAYYTCETCGKHFEDEEGNTEITDLETYGVLKATGHRGGKATCTAQAVCEVCGNGYGELAPHELTHYDEEPATCTEAGNREYWECSVCNQLFADAQGNTTTTIDDITISPAGHTMTKQEEVPATCTEPGSIAYWQCETCGKRFADEEGTEEVDSVEVSELGHNVVKTEAKAPTATEPGNIEYWHCERCGKYFKDEALTQEITQEQTVLAATGETEPSTPEQPSGPSEPEENPADPPKDHPGSGATDSPQTGDDGNIALWITVMLAAVAALTGTVLYNRKKKYSR